MADDLERWLRHEVISARAAAPMERLGKWIRRKPVHAALAATGVIAIAALAAGTVISLRQAARANRAQREAILTLADMYTRSGLTAAANNDPVESARAALWFANAAIIGADDPERHEANLRRTTAWRRETTSPVRALVTGHDYLERMLWNPRQPAMIVWAARESPSMVWDLQSDSLWQRTTNLSRAVWDFSGGRIAAYEGKSAVVLVLAYPSGEELARLPSVGFAPALAFSPDDHWVAVGAHEPFLWDWRTGEQRKLPGLEEAPERFQFDASGRSLLIQRAQHVAICEVENVRMFHHQPMTNSILVRAEFLADGSNYLVGDGDGNIVICDSQTGVVIEGYAASSATAAGGPSVPIAVSPDGRFIARNNAPVVDRSAGGPAGFPLHKNVFGAGAFSPVTTRAPSSGLFRTASSESARRSEGIAPLNALHPLHPAFTTADSLFCFHPKNTIHAVNWNHHA